MKLHMYDGGVRTQHILAPTMGLKVREITLDLDDFDALLGQPDPLLVLITRFGRKEENTIHDDNAVEQEIQDKGLTAPRVTPDRVESVIKDEYYHIVPGTTLTICVLFLENGFTVTGESACASPENFDAELGAKIARDNAKQKIWSLEGYLVRQTLHDGGR